MRCDGSHRIVSLALGLQNMFLLHTCVALQELDVRAGLKSYRYRASVMRFVYPVASSQ